MVGTRKGDELQGARSQSNVWGRKRGAVNGPATWTNASLEASICLPAAEVRTCTRRVSLVRRVDKVGTLSHNIPVDNDGGHLIVEVQACQLTSGVRLTQWGHGRRATGMYGRDTQCAGGTPRTMPSSIEHALALAVARPDEGTQGVATRSHVRI